MILSSNFTCLCLNIFRVIFSSCHWNLQLKTCVKIYSKKKKCNPTSLRLQVDRALRLEWKEVIRILWKQFIDTTQSATLGKAYTLIKKEKFSTASLCHTNLPKVWLSWWVSQTDSYITARNHRFTGVYQCPVRNALLQRTKT